MLGFCNIKVHGWESGAVILYLSMYLVSLLVFQSIGLHTSTQYHSHIEPAEHAHLLVTQINNYVARE